MLYTLSHPENDRDVTGRTKGNTLQDSFMHQSRNSFLNMWDNTHVMCAILSIFLWNTCWRHSRSHGETKYIMWGLINKQFQKCVLIISCINISGIKLHHLQCVRGSRRSAMCLTRWGAVIHAHIAVVVHAVNSNEPIRIYSPHCLAYKPQVHMNSICKIPQTAANFVCTFCSQSLDSAWHFLKTAAVYRD